MRKMMALDAMYMAALSEKQRQEIRTVAASIQQIRKWGYFARHAKKARVRKKYKRRIRQYAEKFRLSYSRDVSGYVYLPSAVELPPFICRYESGAPSKDAQPGCWWVRTTGPSTQRYADEKGMLSP